jgi:hypothetical protein
MSKVNDLGALRLQQASDHVDGGIVSIKERGRSDETQRRRGDTLTDIGSWILNRLSVRLAHGTLLRE